MQRRDFIKQMSTITAVAMVTPVVGLAKEAGKRKGVNHMTFENAKNAVLDGKVAVASSKVHLKAPEIAENGAVVPIGVSVDSPMTQSDYVKAIHIFSSKNGNARCLSAHLSPANGKAFLSTRIKLGGTQDVSALVEMSDGTFLIASKNVKVTIGGCG